MPLVRRAYCWYHGRHDAVWVERSGVDFLPPATLRFHVGSVVPDDYVRIGRACVADLEAGLAVAERSWSDVDGALDFGCGCGRTLVWLRERVARLAGCDLHPESIAWCRHILPDADFRVNAAEPPLDWPAASFDVVYAVSVFTHLDEAQQFRWLGELRRLLRPGGVALLTVHGPSSWGALPAGEREVLASRGFLARGAHGLWGVFPRYFNTYHSEDYVRREWGRRFEVVAYRERGMNRDQDLVVLRKPASGDGAFIPTSPTATIDP